MRVGSVLIAASVVGLMSSAAAGGWEIQLAAQLETEEKCILAFVSQVVEREIDGVQSIIAKAHCEDKRAFDVSRSSPLKPFHITPCGIVEKMVC